MRMTGSVRGCNQNDALARTGHHRQYSSKAEDRGDDYALELAGIALRAGSCKPQQKLFSAPT